MIHTSYAVNKKTYFKATLVFLGAMALSACGGGGGDSTPAPEPDTVPPVLTLIDADTLNISVDDVYVDPGVTATDNVDGDITSRIVIAGDTVDTSVDGTFIVTYNVSDTAGNAAVQLTRTVIVEDTTIPVLTLLGTDPLNLTVGGTYSDPGATALDNLDGDITTSIVVAGDTVNPASTGTYVVTYDVSDAAGNAAIQVTRTVQVNPVDNVAPVITLEGVNPFNINMSAGGTTYTDPGATATDDVDGDITSGIIVGGDTVDLSTPGTYVVTYNVSDAAGNAADEVTRNVVVIDDVVPLITLTGDDPFNFNMSSGSIYSDPGATATDNVDGTITGNIVTGGDSVDTSTPGTYIVTYNVSDAAGNAAAQVTRNVVVIDDVAPEITITGDDPFNFNMSSGGTYTEQGATALDNVDGDITSSIVIGGDSVDTTTPGTYVVTYNVSDAAGNAALQLTRDVVVIDDVAPEITLLGTDPYEVSSNTTYTDPGATASDNADGDITANIIVGGDTVNTSLQGTYNVTYDVSDEAGNAATQQTRAVNVVNDPPVITSFGVNPDPAFVNSTSTFNWDISDVNSDTLTCSLDINNDGTNDYTVNDCSNSLSQGHTFTIAGDYTAKLTVDDGIATPVESTFDFTVISPLSTDVSVNGPAVAGERLLYTITVGNTTALPIDSVAVSFVVPAELSFNSPGNVEPGPGSTICGNNVCVGSEVATWSLGTLAAGETRTITVDALVDSAVLSGVNIILPVIFSGTDINDIQIDKTVEVYNTSSADLALGASKDPVTANETFTYTLDFGNTSAGTLTNTELRAYLPAGVTVSTISDSGTEGTTGEVTWTIGSLGVGESLHREISVTTDAGLTNGEILQARSELSYDGGLVVDNSSEYAITVETAKALPLQVEIGASANPVVADERMIYTVTVSNISLLPVDGVSVLLRVPAELSFNTPGNVEPGPGATICGNNACIGAEEAKWLLGTLAAGETRTITVNPLVDNVLSGNLITLPVRVDATGLEDSIDLLKTVAIYNTSSADLALGASKDPVTANETFTYTLDFGNTSAGTLTSTELRAYLPAGVTVSSISDSGTEGATGEVTWTIGAVNSGVTVHREVSVTVNSSVNTGEILKLDTQLIYDGGLESDNRSEFAVTVAQSGSIADSVLLNISATPDPVASNGVVGYSIIVTNNYGLPVDDVNVLFRVPDELSFSSPADVDPNPVATICGNNACIGAEEAIWSLGTLASGASQVITINATVAAAIDDGNLIVAPFRVTATGMTDVIDLQHTTAVQN